MVRYDALGMKRSRNNCIVESIKTNPVLPFFSSPLLSFSPSVSLLFSFFLSSFLSSFLFSLFFPPPHPVLPPKHPSLLTYLFFHFSLTPFHPSLPWPSNTCFLNYRPFATMGHVTYPPLKYVILGTVNTRNGKSRQK